MAVRKPNHYWDDIQNQKEWFEQFRLENDFDDLESLHKVTGKKITAHGGFSLFRRYGYHPSSVISALYPEYDWKIYKFQKAPKGWWDQTENQTYWFNDFREHYDLESLESLYGINTIMLNDFHGGNIMHIYKSIPNLVNNLVPDYDWKFYKFRGAKGYWEDIENQKLWFEDLREHYGFDTNESLYGLTTAKIIDFYGNYCVIIIYDGSPSDIVRTLIPEYDWKQYKFKNSPQGYWDDRKNIESWFEDLMSHYGLSTNEDLYGLTLKMILQYYGRSPLLKLGDSKIELVRNLIPEYDWKEYKFIQTRKDYWNDIENQKSWFKDFREHYDLTTYESLYDASLKMMKDYYGGGLMTRGKTNYAGSPALFIQAMCPEYDWDLSKFASNRKTQRLLFRTIKEYYPDTIWEYKTEVRWSERNKIGFDIYVPSLKTAFEGQGHQHYIPVEIWGGDKSLRGQIMRDARKLEVAEELGIKVAIVPFCDLDPELPEWELNWESLVRICDIQGLSLESS